MNTLTGIDLPAGSPGGSVELLRDLYLAPDRPIDADVFMLAGGEAREEAEADTVRPASGGTSPVLLSVPGKQSAGPGFWSYVTALTAVLRQRFAPGDHGVVHLQHLTFGATPALLRAFPGHPHIALVHGTDLLFAADHPTQAEVLRETVRRATAIVVPTAAMAVALRALADVDDRRVLHIPWGIPDRLLAAPPPRLPHDGAKLRLLYAGRLTAEKGVSDIVTRLIGIPGVTLSMAAPVAEYRALADRLELTGVRYLGWLTRPRLWQAFSEHDALVMPSTRLEAFGLVAVEAQACGLPVLHTPVPGLAEVLGDSALAVDFATDPGAATAVVTGLRDDPGALADLRSSGRRNAARFPLSRTASELRALSSELAI